MGPFAICDSFAGLLCKFILVICMGAFNNYVDRILPFFDPPTLRGHFFYPERGQRQTFFDPHPPHLVHVVIEWPLWYCIPDLHAN